MSEKAMETLQHIGECAAQLPEEQIKKVGDVIDALLLVNQTKKEIEDGQV